MDVVVASKNHGKIREIRGILDLPGLNLLTFEDLGDWPEREETGLTFQENATMKAAWLLDRFGRATLADDSGLEVDWLGGRPGVRSSRYAGPECDHDRNIAKLLEEMEDAPPASRTARFVCVIALALPGGEVKLARGDCEGVILGERIGVGGFGYDSIFQPAGFGQSMAQLSLEEKNSISHRGKALRAIHAKFAVDVEVDGRPQED
ncbi:MAG: non-canonical purine NTP pyrophosphatase, RdgB/HAM1 family [Candidatus Anoxymicrobium japonicum]|uniref:dITP/XTP pyrophosphatase n=1 Tax=Candidatus Anoxymicrobium japonicum TaxID=2013648 RepID=A0A2N3G8I5_9ACTN|nr:MAG: non-canonical purine NTP pyrophosphatase, RdgB/HAM1 family [Candidatus Anoxymicrobium japonicum]